MKKKNLLFYPWSMWFSSKIATMQINITRFYVQLSFIYEAINNHYESIRLVCSRETMLNSVYRVINGRKEAWRVDLSFCWLVMYIDTRVVSAAAGFSRRRSRPHPALYVYTYKTETCHFLFSSSFSLTWSIVKL